MTELSLPAMYDLGLNYSYCNYSNWIKCIIGNTHVKFDYYFKMFNYFSIKSLNIIVYSEIKKQKYKAWIDIFEKYSLLKERAQSLSFFLPFKKFNFYWDHSCWAIIPAFQQCFNFPSIIIPGYWFLSFPVSKSPQLLSLLIFTLN